MSKLVGVLMCMVFIGCGPSGPSSEEGRLKETFRLMELRKEITDDITRNRDAVLELEKISTQLYDAQVRFPSTQVLDAINKCKLQSAEVLDINNALQKELKEVDAQLTKLKPKE